MDSFPLLRIWYDKFLVLKLYKESGMSDFEVYFLDVATDPVFKIIFKMIQTST